VEATSAMASVIARVSSHQSAIALAVERQTTLTAAISQNVTEAARGSQEIADNITGVAEAARQTSVGASDTQTASRQLRELSSKLDEELAVFALHQGASETSTKRGESLRPARRAPPAMRSSPLERHQRPNSARAKVVN